MAKFTGKTEKVVLGGGEGPMKWLPRIFFRDCI